MAKIHVLDKHVAELIAAGEVVERPASVVKELVENSIDAGATVITVEIKGGGNACIRVTDNGCGMEPEDVPVAFLSHATSKVTSADDLDSILTLGFRGEALASVCAVSKIELFTRTAGQDLGTKVTAEGSAVLEVEENGCPMGTTIIVRDLFYNTPARIKFLKKDVTEGNAVANVMDKLALSHPEVSFKFIRDQKLELHTPGDSKLSSCAYAVLGKAFTAEALPVEFSDKGITVTGLICTPAAAKANRTYQNFFINSRYVKSKTCMVALEEAYRNSIMVSKFPACVLHIQLPADFVDVNVHPAKTEVRFMDEKPVFDVIYWSVKNTLQAHSHPKQAVIPESKPRPLTESDLGGYPEAVQMKITPQAAFAPSGSPETVPEFGRSASESGGDFLFSKNGVKYQTGVISPVKVSHTYDGMVAPENLSPVKPGAIPYNDQPVPVPVPQPAMDPEAPAEPAEENPDDLYHYEIIGECFNTYIILQNKQSEELLFIDKHAAHERILFEKLKKQKNRENRQVLLTPVVLSLSRMDYDTAIKSLDILESCGFLAEDFGNSTLIVREIPIFIKKEDTEEIVLDILGKINNNVKPEFYDKLEELLHSMACRAAIKANDISSPKELESLVAVLRENQELRYCPHGRPIKISLSKKDLEKQFGRI